MEATEHISKKGGIMKKVFLTVLGVGVLSSGYFLFDQVKQNHLLQDQLNQQRFYAENNERAFSAIENNLSEISSAAGIIGNTSNENIKSGSAENVIKEIVFIDKLMNKNREIIKNLSASLDAKDKRLAKYRKLIGRLEKQMDEYKARGNVMVAESQALKMDMLYATKLGAELQKEVYDLQRQVTAQDEEIDSKNKLINIQSEDLSKKEMKIKTAYYVVGTYKDLITNNVVEKKGGVIGIGRTKSLKTDFDHNAFHQIDIYSYRNIPVFGGDISILTIHNTGSYQFIKDEVGNVQWIKVTDEDKFWESSKYLVVANESPMRAGKMTVINPDEY